MDYNPSEVEKEILEFWEKNKIYQKIKEKNKTKTTFYYLDGPPYTTGKIHVGHAWGKALRDCLCRYKRMAGYNVLDTPGFDMHGLPIEVKVEEKLNLKGKEDIVKYGMEKFIKTCEQFALENMEPMIKDFKRVGVWLDWDKPYMSIKNSYIEGAWWAIAEAYKKGLLYKGKKVMTWCPRCATALAKHELEYQTRYDDSIFLKFKIKDKQNEYLIVWTTTPWTIPFNMAVMVNPELEYVRAKVKNEIWIIAKALHTAVINAVAGEQFELVEELKGEQLKGLKYEHPLLTEIPKLHEFENLPNTFAVILSDKYVDASAGTGLVHCAPGCGPEDYEVGQEYGIPPFNNVDENGVFQNMGKYTGWKAKEDDKKFIEDLKQKKCLIETTKVDHEYAHCWRCESPVIFRATEQWFLAVEKLKDKMLAENERITWTPDWAGNRWFKSWLTDLHDWCISRQRYWGIPLPIWQCECGNLKLISTKEELPVKIENLHRPYIDQIKIKCSCGKEMSRVEDILDVWLDSGAAPWAVMNWPKDKTYQQIGAADFILEGKDQIRGWFNSLMCLSMASFGKPSYKAVYMHGMINDSQGRKMSKHLGNTISPYEVVDKYGADSMRYYMIQGTSPGLDLSYNFKDVETKLANLRVLWNMQNYLIQLSKEADNPEEVNEEVIQKVLGTEEKYMLSKLNSTIKKTTMLFENYKINEVPNTIEELYLELSRTYIQMSREKETPEEKLAVLYTTYQTTLNTLKMLSPTTPFICEKIYQNIKKCFGLKEESIFQQDWPIAEEKMINEKLEADMTIAKEIITAGMAAREKSQLGLKWPIKTILVHAPDKGVKESARLMEDVIKKQLNARTLEIIENIEEKARPNSAQLGKDFGSEAAQIVVEIAKNTKEVLKQIREKSKYSVLGKEIGMQHLTTERIVPAHLTETQFQHGYVYVDKTRTPELDQEGFARELMRTVQELRKKAGLSKVEEIELHIVSDEELSKWKTRIQDRCRARTLEITKIEPSKKYEQKEDKIIKNKKAKIMFNVIE